MTAQEVRLDILSRGFFIAERHVSTPMGHCIEVVVSKLDTDNLRYDYTQILQLQSYLWDDVYTNTIKQFAFSIETLYNERHNQNINTCQHDLLLIGSNKACKRCMGKFGQTIPINLTFN